MGGVVATFRTVTKSTVATTVAPNHKYPMYALVFPVEFWDDLETALQSMRPYKLRSN